jgi:Ca2+-binding EF-hand superfamily protein
MLGPGSGTIDVKELKAALNSMGQNPTDEELFVIIHDVRHWAVAC